jgi:hypothetical protein
MYFNEAKDLTLQILKQPIAILQNNSLNKKEGNMTYKPNLKSMKFNNQINQTSNSKLNETTDNTPVGFESL